MRLNDIKLYDGKMLHNRFAYSIFKDRVEPTGNIIAYRSPMKVELEGMIDLEDVMNDDFIYSDDAINFLWEIPALDSMFGATVYQRYFNTLVADILCKIIECPIEMRGDDLIVHKEHNQGNIIQPYGKCSVSIACMNQGVGMSHLGINIKAGEQAPAHAYSTNLNDDQVDLFMNNVINMFYDINKDIFVSTTKII